MHLWSVLGQNKAEKDGNSSKYVLKCLSSWPMSMMKLEKRHNLLEAWVLSRVSKWGKNIEKGLFRHILAYFFISGLYVTQIRSAMYFLRHFQFKLQSGCYDGSLNKIFAPWSIVRCIMTLDIEEDFFRHILTLLFHFWALFCPSTIWDLFLCYFQ